MLNHSHHDGHKRFDNLRVNSRLMKEKAAAQAAGDRKEVKRVAADIKRVNAPK